jgi:rsbT antagonist protein RsbS
MVDLMGGQTVIAGMRPAVAITATQLGLDFGNLSSALDAEKALDTLEKGDPVR